MDLCEFQGFFMHKMKKSEPFESFFYLISRKEEKR